MILLLVCAPLSDGEGGHPVLLVFEVLDGAEAFEGAVDHDGQASAESFTLLHTGGRQRRHREGQPFIIVLLHVGAVGGVWVEPTCVMSAPRPSRPE